MKLRSDLLDRKQTTARTLQSWMDGKRLQTRTRQTFWDKMHLAKVIERPFLDWVMVEW
jgi:hypothetical protein